MEIAIIIFASIICAYFEFKIKILWKYMYQNKRDNFYQKYYDKHLKIIELETKIDFLLERDKK